MTEATKLEVAHAKAPGKINVYLKVGAAMEDGYHEVATAYQAVSLYEQVWAYPADNFSVSYVGGSIDVTDVPVDASNLALKAARLLARKAKYRGGVRLEIEKNVPVAGGMGGGSADAAATLVACNALWGTGLHTDELMHLGAQLGADVPFALMGGTAIGTGRGDRLSPALAVGHFEWVLVASDFGLSTPVVYSELDAHRARHVHDIEPAPKSPSVDTGVLQAIRAGDAQMLADRLMNDLQAPALHLEPSLITILETGEKAGALAGMVSGSGPTIAFLVEDGEAAIDLQVDLSAAGYQCIRVTGPVAGAKLIND